MRNAIAHLYVKAANLELSKPLHVIAKGEQPREAREAMVDAARLAIFLDVLRELPADFDLYDFSAD